RFQLRFGSPSLQRLRGRAPDRRQDQSRYRRGPEGQGIEHSGSGADHLSSLGPGAADPARRPQAHGDRGQVECGQGGGEAGGLATGEGERGGGLGSDVSTEGVTEYVRSILHIDERLKWIRG